MYVVDVLCLLVVFVHFFLLSFLMRSPRYVLGVCFTYICSTDYIWCRGASTCTRIRRTLATAYLTASVCTAAAAAALRWPGGVYLSMLPSREQHRRYMVDWISEVGEQLDLQVSRGDVPPLKPFARGQWSIDDYGMHGYELPPPPPHCSAAKD